MANSVSSLTVGGLIKHVASVERDRIHLVLERQPETPDDYEANFRMERAETLQSILDMYDAVARDTAAVVETIADLGQAVPVPKGVPWFPDDLDAWSVRWVLLHLSPRRLGMRATPTSCANRSTERPFPVDGRGRRMAGDAWLTPWAPAEGEHRAGHHRRHAVREGIGPSPHLCLGLHVSGGRV